MPPMESVRGADRSEAVKLSLMDGSTGSGVLLEEVPGQLRRVDGGGGLSCHRVRIRRGRAPRPGVSATVHDIHLDGTVERALKGLMRDIRRNGVFRSRATAVGARPRLDDVLPRGTIGTDEGRDTWVIRPRRIAPPDPRCPGTRSAVWPYRECSLASLWRPRRWRSRRTVPDVGRQATCSSFLPSRTRRDTPGLCRCTPSTRRHRSDSRRR